MYHLPQFLLHLLNQNSVFACLLCHLSLQRPGGGGRMVRAAGTSAAIQYKEEKFAVVKLPSGEVGFF